MIYSYILKPIFYGNWLLRATNDIDIIDGLSYIKIDKDIIKIKTLKHNGIIGIKNSRTARINDILFNNDSYLINLNYSTKNIYSYSILGIEIPEIKANSKNYNKITNLNITAYDKTLLIYDHNSSYYYIFDLYIGNIKYPNIETNINTFIFTQFISILLNLLIGYYINMM
jgi:hypothetical protein